MVRTTIIYQIDFDNLENHSEGAKYRTTIGAFRLPDEYEAMKSRLLTHPVTLYSGWDGQIYPQFETEEVYQ